MHRAFFVITIGIAAWMFGMVLLIATSNFIFAVLAFWGGEATVIGFMIFSKTFPDGRMPKIPWIAWVPWAVLAVLTASHWLLASAAFNPRGYLDSRHGVLFPLFTIVMTSYVVISLSNLLKAFRRSRGLHRVQMRYFLLGAGVFLGAAVVCNVLLPALGIFSLNLVGPLFSIFFVGCTAYAIVQHEFLDIRIIIKRSITYLASIGSVAIIFFSFEFVVEKFFYYNDEIVDIAAAMVGAVSFFWLRNAFVTLTDRTFFRAEYDYADAMHDLGPVLNSTIELDALIAAIDRFLAQTIKPVKTIFLVGCAEKPFLFMHDALLRAVERDIALHHELIVANHPSMAKPLIVQEAELNEPNEGLRAYVATAERHGFSAIIPFFANDAVVGTLFLGKKLSDDILRQKDIALLSVLSHQGGMAIENARLYESIRRSKENLEDIVTERTKEIREMYRAQEQFVTDISHQLQTPIAILEGNLELAEKQPSLHVKRSLRIMRDTLDGMAHLVSNFLEIAKLNFSKNKFHNERFDVGGLVGETYEDCLVLAETKNVRMHCAVERAVIVGDRRKIKEVLLNLVSNALKHTGASGMIELGARPRGAFAEITVRDTGTGIPLENLPHIFERFYRIPEAGVHGTGLGLNICREIIELHGGTISVASMVGEGSTFTVRLPLASESNAAASAIL